MAIKKLNKLITENDIGVKGIAELSSDKSLSIRAIIFASIAHGISKIRIKNPGEDVQTAIQAIKNLGIEVIKKMIHTKFLDRDLAIVIKKIKFHLITAEQH